MDTAPAAPPPHPPASSAGGIALLLLAALPYALLIAALPAGTEVPNHGSGEARMDWAFQSVFAAAGAMGALALPWLAVWRGARIGGLSAWGRGIAPFAAAGSAVALFVAYTADFDTPDLGLSLAVAALPPPIALLALKACLPGLAHRLECVPVDKVAIGLTTVLSLAIVPLTMHAAFVYPAREAHYLAAREAEREAAEAESKSRDAAVREAFGRLGPDSPLEDFFRSEFWNVDRGAVLARARQSTTRQADAVAMLAAGRIDDLRDLDQLDLEPTPALCEAWRTAFVQAFDRPDQRDDDFRYALERHAASMRWLMRAHCDLSAPLGLIDRRLSHLVDTESLYSLANLSDLDPAPGPTLCAAFAAALARDLTHPETGNGGIYLDEIERQMPNIVGLHGAGCDLDAAIGAIRSRLAEILDGPGWVGAADDPNADNSVWAVRRSDVTMLHARLWTLRASR